MAATHDVDIELNKLKNESPPAEKVVSWFKRARVKRITAPIFAVAREHCGVVCVDRLSTPSAIITGR